MPYVASTLTCSQEYAEWVRPVPDRVVKAKSVKIKGGYGLANEHFVTPSGAVITEVSDEDLAFLKGNKSFAEHEKNGFVTIMGGRNPSPEKIEKSMTQGDKSQPIKPSAYDSNDNTDAISVHVNNG